MGTSGNLVPGWRIVIALVFVLNAAPAFADDVFRVTVPAANVREQPNTTSAVVGRAERGTILRIVAFEEGWVRVAVPVPGGLERVGYVAVTLGVIEDLPVQRSQGASSALPAAPPAPAPPLEPPPAPSAPIVALAPPAPASDPAATAPPAVPSQPAPVPVAAAPATQSSTWQREYDDALRRKNGAKKKLLFGLIGSGGGVVIMLASAGSCDYSDFDCSGASAAVTVGLLVAIGASGYATWNYFQYADAQSDLNRLELQRLRPATNLAIPAGAGEFGVTLGQRSSLTYSVAW